MSRRSPVDAFEQRLEAFLRIGSEEARAVRVGEKETSEQAAIVAALRGPLHPRAARRAADAEAAATGDDREVGRAAPPDVPGGDRHARARGAGGRARERAPRARVSRGTERSCRFARPRRASRSSPTTAAATRSGERCSTVSSGLQRRAPRAPRGRNELETDVTGDRRPRRAQRGREGRSASADPRRRRHAHGSRAPPAFMPARDHWLDRLLGPEREETPANAHVAWIRRLSPLESTYTKERSVAVCLATLRAHGLRPRRRSAASAPTSRTARRSRRAPA